MKPLAVSDVTCFATPYSHSEIIKRHLEDMTETQAKILAFNTVDADTIREWNAALGKDNPRFQPLEEGAWHVSPLADELLRQVHVNRLDKDTTLPGAPWLREWKKEIKESYRARDTVMDAGCIAFGLAVLLLIAGAFSLFGVGHELIVAGQILVVVFLGLMAVLLFVEPLTLRLDEWRDRWGDEDTPLPRR